jgi:hypothetical protein
VSDDNTTAQRAARAVALLEERWYGSGWKFAWHDGAIGGTFTATRAGLRIDRATATALEEELYRWARATR